MSSFATIESALADLQAGKMVLVVDDENRENEGDFVMAAEKVKPEDMNFMRRYGSGVVCAPITREVADRLRLPAMVADNSCRFSTNFTVSVDYREGTATGISAADRAATVQALAREDSRPEDFMRPGHIFPLLARSGGVVERRGHTEASVDLMKLAGLKPVAVLCEVTNEDGSMARLPHLTKFSQEHGLKIITIQSLVEYRMCQEIFVEKVAVTPLPTEFGDFTLHVYRNIFDGTEQVALTKGSLEDLGKGTVLTRVHSECFTGDILKSHRCDCGEQLVSALEKINEHGRGVVVYLCQEGRGIGLGNKVKAYALQDDGYDTVQANKLLGFEADLRDYAMAAQILKEMGVTSVNLLTNNPAKIEGLKKYGVAKVERTELEVQPRERNKQYLVAKKKLMGHILRHVS